MSKNRAHFILNQIAVVIATFFYVGYIPIASGTCGTLAAVPLFYVFATYVFLPLTIFIVLVIVATAILSAHIAGKHFQEPDSGRIVIDEVAGYLVATMFLPFSLQNMIVSFVLFRFFDIVKIWPASFFDKKIKNGFGVVLDDVVSGIYTMLLMLLNLHWLKLGNS